MRSRTIIGPILMVVGFAALSGCEVRNDLGRPCTLVKRDPSDPSGLRGIPLKEKEVPAGHDFISFGAQGCEENDCVRDALYVGSTDPEAEAKGYCSKACSVASAQSCSASSGNIEDGRPLICRSLTLDDATLRAFQEADPEGYQRYFGTNQTSTYCAKDNTLADGGT